MVHFNEATPGVRLGQVAQLGLSIFCTRCQNTARVRLSVALRLWGERSHLRDIAKDLRCSRCGAAAACVMTIADTRPYEVIQLDRSNGFDGGPPYPEVNPPPSAATLRIRAQRKKE